MNLAFILSELSDHYRLNEEGECVLFDKSNHHIMTIKQIDNKVALLMPIELEGSYLPYATELMLLNAHPDFICQANIYPTNNDTLLVLCVFDTPSTRFEFDQLWHKAFERKARVMTFLKGLQLCVQ